MKKLNFLAIGFMALMLLNCNGNNPGDAGKYKVSTTNVPDFAESFVSKSDDKCKSILESKGYKYDIESGYYKSQIINDSYNEESSVIYYSGGDMWAVRYEDEITIHCEKADAERQMTNLKESAKQIMLKQYNNACKLYTIKEWLGDITTDRGDYLFVEGEHLNDIWTNPEYHLSDRYNDCFTRTDFVDWLKSITMINSCGNSGYWGDFINQMYGIEMSYTNIYDMYSGVYSEVDEFGSVKITLIFSYQVQRTVK